MKFSIVTPSYNQGQFINQTIDSVINQIGDFEIEYFVMDGGSTDNTIDILKKYEQILKSNPKIKFYWQSKPDKGQSDAINQGFAKATGDIFAFINSDDYYLPNAFHLISQKYNPKIQYWWCTGFNTIVNESNQQIQRPVSYLKSLLLRIYSYSLLLLTNFIPQPSTFFSKSSYSKLGPFDQNLHLTMDYNLWLSIGKHQNPIIIPHSLSCFRIHGSSKGKNQYVKQFQEDLSTAQKYTNNKIIIFLHNLINNLIVFIYKIIK